MPFLAISRAGPTAPPAPTAAPKRIRETGGTGPGLSLEKGAERAIGKRSICAWPRGQAPRARAAGQGKHLREGRPRRAQAHALPRRERHRAKGPQKVRRGCCRSSSWTLPACFLAGNVRTESDFAREASQSACFGRLGCVDKTSCSSGASGGPGVTIDSAASVAQVIRGAIELGTSLSSPLRLELAGNHTSSGHTVSQNCSRPEDHLTLALSFC